MITARDNAMIDRVVGKFPGSPFARLLQTVQDLPEEQWLTLVPLFTELNAGMDLLEAIEDVFNRLNDEDTVAAIGEVNQGALHSLLRAIQVVKAYKRAQVSKEVRA